MGELRHCDREIYELDERIGRLALISGANLSRSSFVVRLIKGQFDVCEHKNALSKAKLGELRGLLMLKYRIEAECVDDFGVEHFDHLLSGSPPAGLTCGVLHCTYAVVRAPFL